MRVNKKGLKQKYNIQKVDGRPVDENAKYFVLRYDCNQLNKDFEQASKKALLVFAEHIESTIPELAYDLRSEISQNQPT
tara:strand:- start:58 stop:294 length:237 start_codon:yes stop_codon:yes gene_type:complete